LAVRSHGSVYLRARVLRYVSVTQARLTFVLTLYSSSPSLKSVTVAELPLVLRALILASREKSHILFGV
jgi:hypothetical protein